LKPIKPLFYYKWHWQDWRANRSVQRMNYIEKGLYRELLDECWSEGFIPDDIDSLAEICGCPVDVMANAWQVLSKCFEPCDGGFLNERLEKERTELDKIRVKRAQAGSKGGHSKILNEKESEANAKQMLANAKQLPYRRVEKSRVEKTLTSSDDDNRVKIDYQGIVDLYNRILPELPRVAVLSQKRKSAIRTCAATKPRYHELEFWELYFKTVRESDFLMGKSKNWRADIDFLITHNKFIKIIEGGYK
jgi:uncharacterized protein YdaU (DUF1376 family)